MTGDPGMRPAQTKVEQQLKLAAHLDKLFQRYGWDLKVYMRQPRWLLTALSVVAGIEASGVNQAALRQDKLAKLQAKIAAETR